MWHGYGDEPEQTNLHMRSIYIFLVLIVLSGACKEMEYGSLTVSLKNGPTQYEEVNVEITGVEIYVEGIHNPGWFRLSTNSGVYNLLLLQQSSVLLAQAAKVPAARVSQVRITFGSNNTVRTDNQVYSLRMPLRPGERSYSVLVAAGYDIQANSPLNILIDMDTERSVIQQSKGGLVFEPVAISGVIGSPLEIF